MAAQEAGLRHVEGKLQFGGWLKMKYHLFYCSCCRLFLRQSALIDKALHNHKGTIAGTPVHKMRDEKKADIQEKINAEI